MRNHGCDPCLGILQMVEAHNEMDRVGGYAPCQWAYGRLPSWDSRLFEGGNHGPVHSTEAILGTDLRANLNLRVQAEEVYRKSTAAHRISRAMNSQPQRVEVFLPGNLVYYRRYSKRPHVLRMLLTLNSKLAKWVWQDGSVQPES